MRARRFSYTDFRLGREEWGAAGARATLDPHVLAEWLDRARPRNQASPRTAPRPALCGSPRRGSLCAVLCARRAAAGLRFATVSSLWAQYVTAGRRGAQDDVAPLLVLTKDILRKFHLGEVAPALHAPPPGQIGRTSLPLPLLGTNRTHISPQRRTNRAHISRAPRGPRGG